MLSKIFSRPQPSLVWPGSFWCPYFQSPLPRQKNLSKGLNSSKTEDSRTGLLISCCVAHCWRRCRRTRGQTTSVAPVHHPALLMPACCPVCPACKQRTRGVNVLRQLEESVISSYPYFQVCPACRQRTRGVNVLRQYRRICHKQLPILPSVSSLQTENKRCECSKTVQKNLS